MANPHLPGCGINRRCCRAEPASTAGHREAQPNPFDHLAGSARLAGHRALAGDLAAIPSHHDNPRYPVTGVTDNAGKPIMGGLS